MQSKKSRNLAITALFVAIFLLQTYLPNIGYIRIFPALPAITTVPLTVAVYASISGPQAGMLFGLFWGLVRLFQAYTQPGDVVSLLLFQNIFIAVIPSVMAGFLPGLVIKFFKNKTTSIKSLGYFLAGAVTSMANTLFVILLATLVFNSNAGVLISHMSSANSSTPLIVILFSALSLNGLIEAIFTAVVTPIIMLPVEKIIRRL